MHSPVYLHVKYKQLSILLFSSLTVSVCFFIFCNQEEEALLSEMDVTGQAFEDMQEMNTRLLQQLREKDDANFKLMSEVSLWRVF